jgi:glycosyltransferase involved in cell wall biosynthesis
MTDDQLSPDRSQAASVSLLYVSTVAHTISHFLLPYAARFRAMGWRLTAAASGASTDPALRDAFDAVYELPLSRSIVDLKGLVWGERAVADVLATRPDIVHVHTPIASFVTRFAASRMTEDERPLVVYTAHGFHFHKDGGAATNAVFRAAEQLAGRWTDRIVVINDEDYSAARRYRIVPPSHVIRMPGIGIDTGYFSRSAIDPEHTAQVRLDIGIGQDGPLFVVVAEFNRNKRVGDVIEAIASMKHRDAKLLLLGSGRDRDHLEALTDREGVRGRVRFGGLVDDVRPLVSAATALVLPSRREGLNRSIMEALALEVPVIASTARGNQELVGSDAGLIVRTGDIVGIAAAMDWMVDHPQERVAMGQRGRTRMVEDYDLQIVIRRHEAMYRQMLDERRAGPDQGSGVRPSVRVSPRMPS